MTDITPMPNNAENYYRKAINALENNHFTEGIHLLEKSYKLDEAPHIFTELIKLYITFNQQNDLLRLWRNDRFTLDFISESTQLISLYSQSLPIMSPTSESLNKLYQLRDLNQSSTVTIELNKSIKSITTQLEIRQKINNLDTEEKFQAYVHHLLSFSHFDLLSELKQIYQTDLNKNLPLLKALLMQENILNFIKNDILHYILNSKENINLELCWLNTRKNINTIELKAYKDTDYYKDGTTVIEDYFAQTDPHFATQVHELFNLHVMIFYPFFEETISNPKDWLRYTLIQFGLENGDDEILNDKEIAVYQMAQNELNQLFQV